MLSRRDFVLSGSALLCAGGAIAAPSAASMAQAADYSRAHGGVSLVVRAGGQVIFEDYPNGGGPNQMHELASGTKSFSGIMAGALVADGLMRLDDACARFLPEWAGDRRASITVRDLLTLTSGLGGGTIGRPPTYVEAIATPIERAPGQVFQYGPTPFQVFGEITRRALANAGRTTDPVAYLDKRILQPNNIAIGRWRRGSDQNPLLPQGAMFTAREWSKFGQWVADGARGIDPSVASALFTATRANPGYGLTWWLLREGLIGPSPRSRMRVSLGADAAKYDVAMAAGLGDQRLYLVRSAGLVVVRQAPINLRAMRQPNGWDDAAFLRLLLG